MNTVKKLLCIVLVLMFTLCFASCSGSSADSRYDDAMAAQDWGDGYYYDSNDNAVKKTLW
ncbi:MAG: hypothetical protein J6B25_09370 [Clostridia bacterium]|nr:hypothetical protein [Clostridia bacterium]